MVIHPKVRQLLIISFVTVLPVFFAYYIKCKFSTKEALIRSKDEYDDYILKKEGRFVYVKDCNYEFYNYFHIENSNEIEKLRIGKYALRKVKSFYLNNLPALTEVDIDNDSLVSVTTFKLDSN